MGPLASSIFWVLNWDRIPSNLSFVSLFHQLMFYYQYLHYTTCISGITHYVSKYHSKSLFNAHRNLFWSKSSMELSTEFHGTFWKTFEQHLWFHGIPWNLSHKTSSSMEFHGILSRSNVPWNSVELFPYSRVPWNSIEFHGTYDFPHKSYMEFHGIFLKFRGIPWNLINLIFKKIILLNIVVGVWLMIRCYLADI